ncbi:type II secretion system minor pseudopilin GspJ [Spongiibacter sp. KMU-166]|uniref:Type II secretion system protein J n=1 Tax=Spongiibacter thalassae TaxID=2721624 RepID=A0ABX1GCG8_9GAMM|nr:type II secretion system minor pseudopilin GspJ [Spongiibacter thalassae]NKI16851.1 type II secretion system minor pseudopilin GspJ [Spongiibacter thalassae]
MSASARDQHGFTLVELLIAIGIMALLGALASIMLNGALSNQQIVGERQYKLERVALALHIMRRDLEQLTPRVGRDEYGDPMAARIVAEQVGENSEMQFVHGGRRILPGQNLGSRLERVRYLREDGELIRYSAAVADPTGNTDWQKQILLEDVDRFVVEFYDGARWTNFWPPSTQLNAVQPAGLRVVMDVGPWPDIKMNVLLPELAQ